MWCWRKMLSISWQEHRTNEEWQSWNYNILAILLGKCRTVGTFSPRRNHGRATASRQTEKTVDTQHWRVDWLWIHSAKGDVTRWVQCRRKISEWSSAVANPHRGRSTSEWVSDHYSMFKLSKIFTDMERLATSATAELLVCHSNEDFSLTWPKVWGVIQILHYLCTLKVSW